MKFKSLQLIILLAITATTLLSSCMTTMTNVGPYRDTPGTEQVYAQGKQVWLIWGIFPLGRKNVDTPKDGNCQVKTRLTFVDLLVSGLTGGIVTTYTITVKVKR
jgi:uncharacterized protein YceK